MTRPTSYLAAGLLAAVLAISVQAQPQSVTISFPNKAAIAISGPAPSLTITTVDPLTGDWTAVSDANTQLSQINNYGAVGSTLKITADFSDDLAASNLTLTLDATHDDGVPHGSPVTADLSDGSAKDLITGLQRGFSRWDLTYTFSAESDAAAINSPLAGTVTFTVTQ